VHSLWGKMSDWKNWPTCAFEPVSRACNVDLPVNLSRAFGPDHQCGTAARSTLPGSFELLCRFAHAPLDVGLKVISSLVFGDDTQHLAQTVQTLVGIAGLPKRRLRSLYSGDKLRASVTRVAC
jgi:hypothetical protein